MSSTPDDEPTHTPGRRDLLRLLGASVALAGFGACTQAPREKILPYSRREPEVTPGVPTFYATSMVRDGFATGLLAKSHEGRPTKLEGNPEHPASLGATGAIEQASVLDLYDPGRLRSVHHQGGLASWDSLLAALQRPREWRPWFVLPPQSSPLLGLLIQGIRTRYPRATFSFTSPLTRRRVYEASALVFGRPLEPGYDFTRARVILALGADFLSGMPLSSRYAREFASARRAKSPDAAMNRLYALEPMPTTTGNTADHRLALRMSAIAGVAGAILREVAALLATGPDPLAWQGSARHERLPAPLLEPLPRADESGHPDFVRAAARDLVAARGDAIVIAGDQAPIELHLLAHALNVCLGNLGRGVWLSTPALLDTDSPSLFDLTRALDEQAVDSVLLLDANPVYWAPPALELERRLRAAPESFTLTYFENETSQACHWVAPLSHYLESWGDSRAADGTVSFIQPLIEPLHPSRSLHELLAACSGDRVSRGHTLLTDYWRSQLGTDFDARFDEHLRRGAIAGSEFPRLASEPGWNGAIERLAASATRDTSAIELNFEVSPALYDGRHANNPWLLELPHPSTKQTWGNAAVVSPKRAAALGLRQGRVVELRVGAERLEAPVLILPGHADDAITLGLGYGQIGPELVSRGLGANAYRLREDDQMFARGVTLRALDREERLAITQDYADTRGRPLALIATLAEYRQKPEFGAELRRKGPSLLPLLAHPPGPQWAMTIDTSICTGCSACVIACQAENNVPVVGKEGVERGREMHWLRIDRYFSGPEAAPQVVHQPMLCQHCEAAPCEYVCPVNATVHSPDGLNEMVYNRCIGTRFCSNNCPYKVRRFNFFEYTGLLTTEQLARNPDVTVRERGVMEKCTYCVQRIRRSEMQARIEQREIEPNEVVTACQQVCPTQAIQFGSLGHTDTPMVQWRKEGRAYAALHDLGTRPRTEYLARLRNPNPDLEG